jgi:WD40-like Beta Propeller Repeat
MKLKTRRARPLTVTIGLVVALGGCAGSGPAPSDAPKLVSAPVASPIPSPSSVPQTAEPSTVVSLEPPPIGQLLFSRFVEASHTFTGMFVLGSNGESSVPLPGPEGGGRWSTDGTEIAVMTVLPDDRIGTAIIDPSGTVLRVLEIPDPTLNAVCTVWSADDARLACEAWDETDESRAGIYAVNSADGGDLERLTTPPAGLSDLPGDFAPDGSFVFKRYAGDEGTGPLMVVPAGGSEPEMLVNSGFEDPGRFAPDGSLIATSIDGVIRVIDRGDGHIVSEIAGGYSFGPAWAPDGEWIVFARATSGPFADLIVARPNGADLRPVTGTPENEITVDWGP